MLTAGILSNSRCCKASFVSAHRLVAWWRPCLLEITSQMLWHHNGQHSKQFYYSGVGVGGGDQHIIVTCSKAITYYFIVKIVLFISNISKLKVNVVTPLYLSMALTSLWSGYMNYNTDSHHGNIGYEWNSLALYFIVSAYSSKCVFRLLCCSREMLCCLILLHVED